MSNKKIQVAVEKARVSLDDSLKALDEAEHSLKAADSSITKTREAILNAQLCVESTRKLLNTYPLAKHQHRSIVFQCAKYDLPYEQIRHELVMELRYFTHYVDQLAHLDPYYHQLHEHYQKLAIKLNSATQADQTS